MTWGGFVVSGSRYFAYLIVMGCLLGVAAPGSLRGQGAARSLSQIAITVSDSTGGVVDGAVAVLTRGTVERRETSGLDGNVRFNNVEAGDWSLEIRKEG